MSNKDTIIESLTMQLRLEREGNLALAKRIDELRQALAEPTWRCPLKKPDCKENCGSYGCGN